MSFFQPALQQGKRGRICLIELAVWQINDGMGTYTIHRIFVYQPEAAFFKELNPDCGDDFVNLRVEREKRALFSTYWEMNEPKLCSTNLFPD